MLLTQAKQLQFLKQTQHTQTRQTPGLRIFTSHILILLASGFEQVANFKDCHTMWALSIVED